MWIGLYNAELFNDENTNCDCTNSGCARCRNMFVWVDEEVGSGFVEWRDNEPANDEKCARLTNTKYAGTHCSTEIGYICYKG